MIKTLRILASTLAAATVLAGGLAGCESNGGGGNVSVGVGYYGGYYPGYYDPYYHGGWYDDDIDIDRPDRDRPERPTTLPSDIGQQRPSSRPASSSSTRSASSMSRPAPRPTPRPRRR